MMVVVRLIIGNTLASDFGFENVLDLRIYIFEMTKDYKKHIIIDKMNVPEFKEPYSIFN